MVQGESGGARRKKSCGRRLSRQPPLAFAASHSTEFAGDFMRKRLLFYLAVGLISFAATTCRAQDRVELFGGYSYVRGTVQVVPNIPVSCPPICGPVTQHVSLSGWEFSGTYKANPWFGVTADFSGHYGTLNGG